MTGSGGGANERRPYDDLSRKYSRLLADLAAILPCYVQMRDGWYRPSCYEAGRKRGCCVNCRVLWRVHGLVADTAEVPA